MSDNAAGPVGFRCAICGCKDSVPFALRGDGVSVVRCIRCGMGVIDPIPGDLLGMGQRGSGRPGQGYSDYPYSAEHGVGWAAALVRLLRPTGGRVLDIGCADGRLLAKLGPGYTAFGIEANEAASRIAAERGVIMLGRDLADPILIEDHGRSFDIITAIAVFEHLRDIRTGMEAALRLMRDDGVLVFEVPLMSAIHDNTVWLTSSLEHVWYPSEKALRQLIETEIGAQMVGAEIFVPGYASTYVGLVFRETADGTAIRKLAARVLLREADPISTDEATARMLLHLVHAATTTPADVSALVNLPTEALNPQLMRRLSELWQGDLRQLGLVRAEASDAYARARRLQAELDAVESDRVCSHTELTTSLVVAQTQLAAVKADLEARIAAEIDLGRQRAALDRDQAAANAALAFATVQSGAVWRVAVAIREAAQRHPRLTRLARRILRVLWWTAQGRLLSQLRLRRTAKKISRAAIAEAEAVIQAVGSIEPDLVGRPGSLETFPVGSFEPDRHTRAWRGLYLSIYQLPKRLILVGSIDDAPELAALVEHTAGLLIVETDAKTVSTAALLPRGTQWRALSEFGEGLDAEDRVKLAAALLNGLQPAALLILGSQAGWEMLARYGSAIRSHTTLFAAITAAPELSAADLLAKYLRSCIPVLSALYGSDEQALYRIAGLFGLTPEDQSKLRPLRDWRDSSGFLTASGGGH
jgi:SAM-dependent methyltransferase